MLRDLWGQAYEAMVYNRRRTAITIVGMAWGIATVVLLLAYGAGFWTEATLAEHQRTETRVVSPTSTISPFEMHRKVKPHNLSVQYMQGDFN